MMRWLVIFILCVAPYATWLTGWWKGHPYTGFWLGWLNVVGLVLVIFCVKQTFLAEVRWRNTLTGRGGHRIIRMKRFGRHQPHSVYVPRRNTDEHEGTA